MKFKWRDTRAGAFLLGLKDTVTQDGVLSSGRSFGPQDRPDWSQWNEAYDRGVNVGEWLFDLLWWEGFWRRWPWEARV